jgi:hypothetical protein
VHATTACLLHYRPLTGTHEPHSRRCDRIDWYAIAGYDAMIHRRAAWLTLVVGLVMLRWALILPGAIITSTISTFTICTDLATDIYFTPVTHSPRSQTRYNRLSPLLIIAKRHTIAHASRCNSHRRRAPEQSTCLEPHSSNGLSTRRSFTADAKSIIDNS